MNPFERVTDIPMRLLRASYYTVAFGRDVPFGHQLQQFLYRWEMHQGKGDVPKGRAAWEQQYATNDWAYLSGQAEVGRYAAIIGYLTHFKPRSPAVLDIGCGEGVLFDRYKPYGYAAYVGVDISEAAIERLRVNHNETTEFCRADAETYRPRQQFDAVIFNESLYYFHDPLRAVAAYDAALNADGVMIISTYLGSRRALAILRELKRRYTLVDEMRTIQGAQAWHCTVLRQRGGSSLVVPSV